jgi:hypothetical protein
VSKTDFEKAYQLAAGKMSGVDHSILSSLLECVFNEALRVPTNRSKMKNALVDLLSFLDTPAGRKTDNYVTVDSFFWDHGDRWRKNTEHLTDDIKSVFDEMLFLHGAVEQPEYHATPEEIMTLVDEITVDDQTEPVKIYVRMIEGTDCSVPVNAKEVAAGQYEISECGEFDPEDTSQLLEYLPGDIVRVEDGKAVALVNSPETEERAYWRFLFEATAERSPTAVDTSSPHFAAVVTRVKGEIEEGTRWHYPSVRDWIGKNVK